MILVLRSSENIGVHLNSAIPWSKEGHRGDNCKRKH